MKGYRIEHSEDNVAKPTIIEQCNYHSFKEIIFYGWNDFVYTETVSQTVAIFKIKWNEKHPHRQIQKSNHNRYVP